MPRLHRQDQPEPAALSLADRLHSAAIHLLRRLRAHDSETGLTAPRLSALSVIVFAGPITISELAAAEQVSLPTISRLVKDLESEGLVTRVPDPDDGRVHRVQASEAGRQLLDRGRRARVSTLAADLERLPAAERQALARAARVLERLTVPAHRPEPAESPQDADPGG